MVSISIYSTPIWSFDGTSRSAITCLNMLGLPCILHVLLKLLKCVWMFAIETETWSISYIRTPDTINNSDALWSMRENRLLSILMMLGYWKPYETDISHWSGLCWTKQEHVFHSTNSVGCLQRHRYEFQYIMIYIKNCFHNMPMVFNEFEHKEIHTDHWGGLKNIFWKQNC